MYGAARYAVVLMIARHWAKSRRPTSLTRRTPRSLLVRNACFSVVFPCAWAVLTCGAGGDVLVTTGGEPLRFANFQHRTQHIDGYVCKGIPQLLRFRDVEASCSLTRAHRQVSARALSRWWHVVYYKPRVTAQQNYHKYERVGVLLCPSVEGHVEDAESNLIPVSSSTSASSHQLWQASISTGHACVCDDIDRLLLCYASNDYIATLLVIRSQTPWSTNTSRPS